VKKTVFMGTTEISPERSAGEITSLLVRAGVGQIATDYREGKLSGLRFTITVAGNDQGFSLPARTEAVLNLLKKQKPFNANFRCSKAEWEERLKADAERIGWRQLLRWVEAQIALMDLGMVKAQEVFFPYLTFDASGQTLFQKFEASGMKMLAAPKPQ
jgi:hypothetical protein